MPTEIIEPEASQVEEPQLEILYYPKTVLKTSFDAKKDTLNVLSLFSGCGGMDLGSSLWAFRFYLSRN